MHVPKHYSGFRPNIRHFTAALAKLGEMGSLKSFSLHWTERLKLQYKQRVILVCPCSEKLIYSVSPAKICSSGCGQYSPVLDLTACMRGCPYRARCNGIGGLKANRPMSNCFTSVNRGGREAEEDVHPLKCHQLNSCNCKCTHCQPVQTVYLLRYDTLDQTRGEKH